MADDFETEAALASLTKEELEQLTDEIDPDNDLLPARERTVDQTTKKPTGQFDRRHLLNYMAESAKTSTVGSDYVTYEKKTRGRVYEPTRKPKAKSDDMDEIEKLLLGMSDSDLGELADALDIDSIPTRASSTSSKKKPRAPAAVTYSYLATESEEDSMDELLKRIQDNDSTLTEVNINNRRVDSETRQQLLRSLPFNSHVQKLLLANTQLDDDDAKVSCLICLSVCVCACLCVSVCLFVCPFMCDRLCCMQVLADHLEKDETIRTVNIESNRLTGAGVRVCDI
jgi:tropomodulin